MVDITENSLAPKSNDTFVEPSHSKDAEGPSFPVHHENPRLELSVESLTRACVKKQGKTKTKHRNSEKLTRGHGRKRKRTFRSGTENNHDVQKLAPEVTTEASEEGQLVAFPVITDGERMKSSEGEHISSGTERSLTDQGVERTKNSKPAEIADSDCNHGKSVVENQPSADNSGTVVGGIHRKVRLGSPQLNNFSRLQRPDRRGHDSVCSKLRDRRSVSTGCCNSKTRRITNFNKFGTGSNFVKPVKLITFGKKRHATGSSEADEVLSIETVIIICYFFRA